LPYDPRVLWNERVPALSGARVTVREVVTRDASSLFELLTDPIVTAHISAPPQSVDAFVGFIRWAQSQRTDRKSLCFGIVPHGLEQAVGILQLRALDPTFFVAEWGFAVGAPFWSTGVFMEAANLVAEFAFTTLNVNRIEARATDCNARGQAALQKLGARPEATLTRAFRKANRRDTQLLWTLREDDWRQRPLLQQRLTAADANEQISRAVEHTRRVLAELPRQEPPACTREHPFFITGSHEST